MRSRRSGRLLASGAAVSILFPLIMTLPSGAATGRAREAQEIRTTWTSEFGLPRPTGLTFDPVRGELLVAQVRGAGAKVLRLSLAQDPQGTFQVPGVTDPGTIAFDTARRGVTALSDGQRVTASGRNLARVSRSDVSDLGLRDPVASTIDPSTGTWFVLDDGADELLRVHPAGSPARISLRHLGASRLGGLAFNAADGLLYVSDVGEDVLYGLDGAGKVRTSYSLASLDLRSPGAMTFAPSADSTDHPDTLNLYVADAGDASRLGGVMEVSLAEPVVALVEEVTATLVQVIDTSQFTPGSPDPSGITYLSGADRLMVADSEVDETTGAGFHDVNLWKITRTGSVEDTGDLTPWTREPTGLGSDEASNTLFVSTDSGDRIYVVQPGGDGRFGTSDDDVTFIDTAAYGSGDTEDPEFDPDSGHLFFIDGTNTEVYRIDPVNGVFGDGDDTMTHFDVGQFGANDIEGLGSDPARDTLLVGDRGQRIIYEVTKAGQLVRTIDASDIPGMRFISGLTMARASNNPNVMNYWIVDRAVDNGANPSENDGKIFEISVPFPGDLFPTVQITSPGEGATVSGTVQIVADASDDQGVTQVEFFDGATPIGTDTDGSNGWSVPWNTAGALEGPHTISATATDTIGQTGSDSNEVTVDNLDGPPTVTITDPASGSAAGGTVQIQADASDDKGVTQVQFFDGATPIGTDTNGANGWSASWDTTGVA
ncbi:MAG TPA: Ig-like domain-containing protein, partial [Actinomycetota bacterium]